MYYICMYISYDYGNDLVFPYAHARLVYLYGLFLALYLEKVQSLRIMASKGPWFLTRGWILPQFKKKSQSQLVSKSLERCRSFWLLWKNKTTFPKGDIMLQYFESAAAKTIEHHIGGHRNVTGMTRPSVGGWAWLNPGLVGDAMKIAGMLVGICAWSMFISLVHPFEFVNETKFRVFVLTYLLMLFDIVCAFFNLLS